MAGRGPRLRPVTHCKASRRVCVRRGVPQLVLPLKGLAAGFTGELRGHLKTRITKAAKMKGGGFILAEGSEAAKEAVGRARI